MPSFGELLVSMRSRYKVYDDECGAAWPLNIHLRPAKAHETIVDVRPCLSRRFVWSEDDQAMICARCWTPRRQRQS